MVRTTQALVFHGAGSPLELREFEVPDPIGREVLVEVVACTLCGSDLHTMQGRRKEPVPTILGHEILGKVVEFGPEAELRDAAGLPLRVGDRVTWAIVASCGRCFYCLRDLPQKCKSKVKYGHEALRPRRELTGGLAGHVLLAPGTAIFRIPEDLPDESACPANCATATVANALEAAGDLAGRSMLIMGCGMLGVTTSAMARTRGAETIIACDVSAERRALARSFAASLVVSPEELASCVEEATEGRGCDAAIELTGSPDAFQAILPAVRIGGALILVGATYPAREISLAMEDVVRRCLTIKGLHNYGPRHLRNAIEFLASSIEYPFSSLVSDWISLPEVAASVNRGRPPHILRIGVRN